MKPTRTLKVLMRLRPALRFIKFRILHIDDSPERIARGLALGVFIAFLPLMGIQMFLAWIAAILFKGNKLMAVLGAWVSNPATAIVIYYPCYRLGRWLIGFVSTQPNLDPRQMEELFEKTLSFYRFLTEIHSVEFWKEVSSALMKIGLETFIGGVILGFLAARLTHWLTYNAILHHRQRKQKKQLKRAAAQKTR